MKVAYIFRGDHVRDTTLDRKYIDALMCYNNWKKTLFDVIPENDIIFITYDSPLNEQIKKLFKPKEFITLPVRNQVNNFKRVLQFCDESEYDRYVILRCDFMYRYKITEWPKWNERGIFIINKDINWPNLKFYSDTLFIIDKEYVKTILNLGEAIYEHAGTIHTLGRELYNKNISFHLMYEEYYHMAIHPIQVLASMEEEPDINNPKVVIPLI